MLGQLFDLERYNDYGFMAAKQANQILAEAHRRPSQPIGSPAIVRHLALWPVPSKRPNGKSADYYENLYNLRRWNWYYELEEFVDRIKKRVIEKVSDANAPVAFVDPKDPITASVGGVRENAPYKSVIKSYDHARSLTKAGGIEKPVQPPDILLMFRWHSYLVKLQVLMHNEYVTMTFIVDLSKTQGDHETGATANQVPGRDHDIFEPIFTTIPMALKEKTEKELHEVSEFLFEKVWDEFDRAFLPDPRTCDFMKSHEANSPGDDALGLKLGSECFADFRGVVLMAGKEDDLLSIAEPSDREQDLKNVRTFSRRQQHYAVWRAWPLVIAASGGKDKAKNLEFTACTMLDSRAIYISSLGSKTYQDRRAADPQVPGVQSRTTVDKVKYVLLLNGLEDEKPVFDRWQIGRLVHRINTLGTLRLIALRDLSLLRNANSQIMNFGIYLDGLYDKHLTRGHDVIDDLRELFKRIADLSEGHPFGMAYRVNRSRYAVNSYKSIVGDLRIRRIPGWQPYDEFVRRRLYSVYDSIDLLGQRVDALRRRADTLLEIVHTRKLVEYQSLADTIVVLAGSYYGGNLIKYALEFATGLAQLTFRPELRERLSGVLALFGEHPNHTAVAGCYVAAFFLTFWVTFYLKRRGRQA